MISVNTSNNKNKQKLRQQIVMETALDLEEEM